MIDGDCRETAKRFGRDPYGCLGPLKEPLSVSKPGRFGAVPGGLDRCPVCLLREPDMYRDAIIRVVQDHRAGLLSDWPDAYTTGVEAAVRMAISESDSAAYEPHP